MKTKPKTKKTAPKQKPCKPEALPSFLPGMPRKFLRLVVQVEFTPNNLVAMERIKGAILEVKAQVEGRSSVLKCESVYLDDMLNFRGPV